MDGFVNGGTASPVQDDPFSFSELLNFDGYGDMCVPSSFDQTSTSIGFSAVQPCTGIWTSFANLDVRAKDADVVCAPGDGCANGSGWYAGSQDKLLLQKTGPSFGLLSNFVNVDNSKMNGSNGGSSASGNVFNKGMSVIPKSLDASLSLAERMLMALSLSKESFGSGFLAQIWMPIKRGDDIILSTYDQPYLLDHMLTGYREISRSFTFAARKAPGFFPGLPGRVFISRRPEWTSNVIYYSKNEFLRVNHALSHRVCGSLAVPVLDSDQSCCAVLELITMKEKPNFYSEIETLCRALQAVNLKTFVAETDKQNLTMSQRAAFSEILDVLTAVCHAHMLPLALTWIPSFCNGATDGCLERNVEQDSSGSKNFVLQVLRSACYISESRMQGFLHACTEHHLTKGQGIAGKVLESNHPFFCPDVKAYDIDEYPLAHHARKFDLHAAVAIRLKSTHTGDDDYILEFFLPVNCKGSVEQQLLLNNLSNTMQRICKSLRTVSDAAVRVREVSDLEGAGTGFPLSDISRKYPINPNDFNSSKNTVLQNQHLGFNDKDDNHHGQTLDTRRYLEKKRSTTEKNISLSVLQQYFSGSLKDAAKNIGVCPTTLKRICRQHGISRWPSRKIHKVNRSLKKIRTVIDSVEGVEGGALKYDSISGSLVAVVAPPGKLVPGTSETVARDATRTSSPIEGLQSGGKSEPDDCSVSIHETGSQEEIVLSKAVKDEMEKACAPPMSYNDPAKLVYLDYRPGTIPWGLEPKDASLGSYFATERNLQLASEKAGPSPEIFDYHIISITPNSMAPADETGSGNDETIEHVHPTSSMTDSSNGSELGTPPSKKCLENKGYAGKCGPTITVKATYKENTVRFKFLPSMGCTHLLEEVAKRFKLAIGTFQLKYMDDEDEWVMLESDADLQECVEILESIGSHGVKILVRDIPCSIGSSAGSNCILMES